MKNKSLLYLAALMTFTGLAFADTPIDNLILTKDSVEQTGLVQANGSEPAESVNLAAVTASGNTTLTPISGKFTLATMDANNISLAPYGTNATEFVAGSGASGVARIQIKGGGNVSTQARVDFPEVTDQAALFRFFRETNTTAVAQLKIFRANGTSEGQHELSGNADSLLSQAVGDLYVGWAGHHDANLKVAGKVSTSGQSATWSAGSGSPEGVTTAPVGSLYSRTDGGAGTSFYVKESGSGNSGWVAK